jgi:ankyrin repeat protein
MLIALVWSSLAFSGEIHDAAMNGDLERVKALLKDNPNWVLSKDDAGRTPLHWAAAKGYKEIAELLLASKAEANAKNNTGLTPLDYATLNKHADLVELLRQHGGQNAFSPKQPSPAAPAQASRTIPMDQRSFSSEIHHAAMIGDLEKVKALIKDNPNLALSILDAAVIGDLEKVKALIKDNPNLVLSKDETGRTPLDYAELYHHTNLFIWLRQHGARSWRERNAPTNATILMAPRSFSSEIHDAVRNRDLEMVKAILKNNPDLVSSKDDGMTPLHWVCRAEIQHQVITYSMNMNSSATGTAEQNNAATGTTRFASSNVFAIAKVLIANGAEINVKDNFGETPLLLAAYSGYIDVVQLLLDNKAEINSKANDGAIPLHLAAAKGHKDVVELLLANKAEVNAKDNDGWTTLHYAASGGDKDVVELLLAKGLDVNAKANDGRTPLHLATAKGHADVAELLRQHGGHE